MITIPRWLCGDSTVIHYRSGVIFTVKSPFNTLSSPSRPFFRPPLFPHFTPFWGGQGSKEGSRGLEGGGMRGSEGHGPPLPEGPGLVALRCFHLISRLFGPTHTRRSHCLWAVDAGWLLFPPGWTLEVRGTNH